MLGSRRFGFGVRDGGIAGYQRRPEPVSHSIVCEEGHACVREHSEDGGAKPAVEIGNTGTGHGLIHGRRYIFRGRSGRRRCSPGGGRRRSSRRGVNAFMIDLSAGIE